MEHAPEWFGCNWIKDGDGYEIRSLNALAFGHHMAKWLSAGSGGVFLASLFWHPSSFRPIGFLFAVLGVITICQGFLFRAGIKYFNWGKRWIANFILIGPFIIGGVFSIYLGRGLWSGRFKAPATDISLNETVWIPLLALVAMFWIILVLSQSTLREARTRWAHQKGCVIALNASKTRLP